MSTYEHNDPKLLNRLLERIEAAWKADRSDSAVDELAADHPAYAAELYEYLHFLVVEEFGPGPSDEEREDLSRRMRQWLDAEALTLIHTSLTGPSDEGSQGNAGDPGPSASSDYLSFCDMLRKVTKLRPSRFAEALNADLSFIDDIDCYPDRVPRRAKAKIIELSSSRFGLNPDLAWQTLGGAVYSKAARRDDDYDRPPPTYREMIEHSRMSAEQKLFWSSFIDEEEVQ